MVTTTDLRRLPLVTSHNALVDDLLDFTSDVTKLGKPVLSDLREGKVTLPLIRLLINHPNCAPAVRAAMEGDVVERGFVSSQHRGPQGGKAQDVELSRERPPHAVLELPRLDRGEEADRAEVDREHRHLAAGEEPKRREDRAVAAEHEREVRVGARLCAEHQPVPRLDLVLLDLSGRNAHLRSHLASELEHAPEGPRDVLHPVMAENGYRLGRPAQGSTLRAAATRSSTSHITLRSVTKVPR